MRREQRLRSRTDFRRVLSTGGRISRPEFVLRYVAGDGTAAGRVGLSVGRRLGSAVTRNRAKRLLRDALREVLHRLEPCDMVVVARDGILDKSPAELAEALIEAATEAGLVTGRDRPEAAAGPAGPPMR